MALQFYKDEIVGIDLPAAVELTVTETEPGIQGDRVSGARKPATLETGLVVQVPLFVNPGDRIKVDTRSRRVPHPGLSPHERPRADRASRAAGRPGAGPGAAVRGRDQGPCRRRGAGRAAGRRPTTLAVELVPGRRRRTATASTSCSAACRPELDARAHGRRRPGPPAPRHLRAARPARPARRRWSSTRPSSWPAGSAPTTRPASSTACCRPSPRRSVRRRPRSPPTRPAPASAWSPGRGPGRRPRRRHPPLGRPTPSPAHRAAISALPAGHDGRGGLRPRAARRRGDGRVELTFDQWCAAIGRRRGGRRTRSTPPTVAQGLRRAAVRRSTPRWSPSSTRCGADGSRGPAVQRLHQRARRPAGLRHRRALRRHRGVGRHPPGQARGGRLPGRRRAPGRGARARACSSTTGPRTSRAPGRCGMQAHLFTGVDDLRDVLVATGLVPAEGGAGAGMVTGSRGGLPSPAALPLAPPLADAAVGIVLRPWRGDAVDAAGPRRRLGRPRGRRPHGGAGRRARRAPPPGWIAGEAERRRRGPGPRPGDRRPPDADPGDRRGRCSARWGSPISTGAGRAEIGFWLAPGARGRGVATAAVGLLAALGAATPLGLRQVWARIDAGRRGRAARRAGAGSGSERAGASDGGATDGVGRRRALLCCRA